MKPNIRTCPRTPPSPQTISPIAKGQWMVLLICANRTINNPYHFLGPTELQAEEAGQESTRNFLPLNIDTGFTRSTHSVYHIRRR